MISPALIPLLRILRLAERVLESWQRDPRPAHDHESIAYVAPRRPKRGEPWSI